MWHTDIQAYKITIHINLKNKEIKRIFQELLETSRRRIVVVGLHMQLWADRSSLTGKTL